MINIIANFNGKYAFLSNFAKSTITTFDEREWPTVEHLYQAAKACTFEDSEIVRNTKGPGSAKRAGRQIKMRNDWDDIKVKVMRTCLFLKFNEHAARNTALLMTKDTHLIEGNTWHDNFWGVCSCDKCKYIESYNMLGKTLMEIRAWINHSDITMWGKQLNVYSKEEFMTWRIK